MIPLDELIAYIREAGSDHAPTFGGTEGGIQVQQIADEIGPCLHAILESGEPVTAYLEIGVAAGGTTFLVDHFLHPQTIVLVDDNRHPKAHVRPYILRDVLRTEVIGHSQAPGTVEVVQGLGVTFDLILIDGDHTYAGVSRDVALYRPMLRPGGFLVFHDSVLPEWGIMRLVEELLADPTLSLVGEYVSTTHPRPLGVTLFQAVRP